MNIFLHLFNVREVFYVGSPLPFYHVICCSPPFQRVFGNILSALPPSIVSLCHGLVLRLFLRIVHLFLSVSLYAFVCLSVSISLYVSVSAPPSLSLPPSRTPAPRSQSFLKRSQAEV